MQQHHHEQRGAAPLSRCAFRCMHCGRIRPPDRRIQCPKPSSRVCCVMHAGVVVFAPLPEFFSSFFFAACPSLLGTLGAFLHSCLDGNDCVWLILWSSCRQKDQRPTEAPSSPTETAVNNDRAVNLANVMRTKFVQPLLKVGMMERWKHEILGSICVLRDQNMS